MSDLHQKTKVVFLLLCFAAAIGYLLVSTSESAAQEPTTRWEEPVVLFDASSSAGPNDPRILFYPFVVVDTDERIKILWSVSVNDLNNSQNLFNGIYCMDGNGVNWSSPVDVITDANGARPDWPQHILDQYGRLTVVWVGSNAKLMFSRAPSAETCDARGWATSVIPAPHQVLYGDIDIDFEGVIHVVYAARGENVYYMRSHDDGDSWTDPVAVTQVTVDRATSFPSIDIDGFRHIHLTWEENQLPQGVPSLGLFYAFSEDEGQTWSASQPFSQTEGEYTQPNLASLGDGTLHRFWNGRASTRGRYHQWSIDGGESWTPITEFIPKDMGGGQTGYPRYALDSSGRLHVVSGTDNVTYRMWNVDHWEGTSQNIMPYLEYPNIVSANGRTLHVVASDFQRIWYVRGTTDAPETISGYESLPMRPQDQARATATPVPAAASTAGPTIAPPSTQPASPSPKASSVTPVLLGSGLAFAVVAAVVAATLGRKRP